MDKIFGRLRFFVRVKFAAIYKATHRRAKRRIQLSAVNRQTLVQRLENNRRRVRGTRIGHSDQLVIKLVDQRAIWTVRRIKAVGFLVVLNGCLQLPHFRLGLADILVPFNRRQNRNRERRENGNDGDDGEQFDERESIYDFQFTIYDLEPAPEVFRFFNRQSATRPGEAGAGSLPTNS